MVAISPSPAASLATDLRRALAGEVRFDAGSRALYATDASNYRQVPLGVVLPRHVEDVLAAVEICRQHGAAILPRGGGTSLAGQGCNAAVVIDMSKYLNRVLYIDPDGRTARVQPGVVLDDLQREAERHRLTFGPDPSTHDRCTLGGMIGNNACGAHSLMAGKTDDNVVALDVLTYRGLRMRVSRTGEEKLHAMMREGTPQGRIYAALAALRDRYAGLIRTRYPAIPRAVSGYNLPALLPDQGFDVARALVGTEGTCVAVLEAEVRLVPSPPFRSLAVLGFPDIYTACERVSEILRFEPVALEGFDQTLIAGLGGKGLYPDGLALLPDGRGWLLIEFGGETRREADGRAQAMMASLEHHGITMNLLTDPAAQRRLWAVREAGVGSTSLAPGKGEYWPGWEDSAVPPERTGPYLRDLRALLDRHGYHDCAFYGHFGAGCVHVRIDFDLITAEGIRRFRSFVAEAAELVVTYGGSLSGEHGDGQARAALLPTMFGDELVGAFREFKAIWDPDGKMNPGKVVDPHPIDRNLRLGTSYDPTPVRTRFPFAAEGGSFALATRRCIGVGKCRKLNGGTMCPSYMVTREEQHSTRGRAHLLFEMLGTNPLRNGWRDRHVKEALDLCLACKGCKAECPVRVDMATYKAEFLAHYYAGRPRPPAGYAFGFIYRWARLAAHAPRLANTLIQAPLLRSAAKSIIGIAPQREIPRFAPRTFKEWFRARGPRNQNSPPVILWPDTFNNHFHPEVAIAAVEVLEAAGYRVLVPEAPLCCGRPLYDYGFLDQARGLLRRILAALRPEIQAGVPVVSLEPSCLAVFRDELRQLFPDHADALRLSEQSFSLSEFLVRNAPTFSPPRVPARAIVHGHCHQKAIIGMQGDAAVLSMLGLDFEILDSGCCGMAGSFGFERDHYDVSIKCGERLLLPAVRKAAPETLILTDGFSCREQIAQTTGRRALHLAEVLQMALGVTQRHSGR